MDDWFKDLRWPQVILIGLIIFAFFFPWGAWT